MIFVIIACLEEDSMKKESSSDTGYGDSSSHQQIEDTVISNDDGETVEEQCPVIYEPDPFIDYIVSYIEGDGAGFGQEEYPDIIFGAPLGGGPNSGSLDVLSLGTGGEIIVGFDDWIITDGIGPDLIVFENPFTGWVELGEVSASIDGETWHTWVCDRESWLGCAGITPVLSHPDNCIDARDPVLAGGDAFDLRDLDLDFARYIRIRDVSGEVGGFDLDAISIVNGSWE